MSDYKLHQYGTATIYVEEGFYRREDVERLMKQLDIMEERQDQLSEAMVRALQEDADYGDDDGNGS